MDLSTNKYSFGVLVVATVLVLMATFAHDLDITPQLSTSRFNRFVTTLIVILTIFVIFGMVNENAGISLLLIAMLFLSVKM